MMENIMWLFGIEIFKKSTWYQSIGNFSISIDNIILVIVSPTTNNYYINIARAIWGKNVRNWLNQSLSQKKSCSNISYHMWVIHDAKASDHVAHLSTQNEQTNSFVMLCSIFNTIFVELSTIQAKNLLSRTPSVTSSYNNARQIYVESAHIDFFIGWF